MSGEITYGIAMLREDAKFFAESGKGEVAARCRAAADRIEALARADDAKTSRKGAEAQGVKP